MQYRHHLFLYIKILERLTRAKLEVVDLCSTLTQYDKTQTLELKV